LPSEIQLIALGAAILAGILALLAFAAGFFNQEAATRPEGDLSSYSVLFLIGSGCPAAHHLLDC
jgi:hypothetical protein